MASINTNYNAYNAYSAYSNYRLNNSASLFGGGSSNSNSLFGIGSSASSQLFGLNSSAYSQYSSSSVMNYLPKLQEKATPFSKAVTALSQSGSGNLFSMKSALSSNKDVLTAMLDSKQAKSAALKPVEVKVDQVATTQKNEGAAMAAKGTGIASGSYAFAVNVGGKEHTFSINVSRGESNEAVQRKMADALNSKNIGVTASVQKGAVGESKLVFESKDTGAAAGDKFSVRDYYAPSGSQGLIAATGIGQKTQSAQDAVYTVDGKQQTSKTNDVDLGNGVKATLKSASGEAVTIGFGRDNSAIKDGVKNFVESYNAMVDLGKSSSKLASALSNATRAYDRALSSAGIQVGADRKMTINEDKLDKAIDNGQIEGLFKSKSNYDFGSRLQQTASSVEKNPMYYTNGSAQWTPYSNTNNMLNSNSQNIFSLLYSGQMFNYFL